MKILPITQVKPPDNTQKDNRLDIKISKCIKKIKRIQNNNKSLYLRNNITFHHIAKTHINNIKQRLPKFRKRYLLAIIIQTVANKRLHPYIKMEDSESSLQ